MAPEVLSELICCGVLGRVRGHQNLAKEQLEALGESGAVPGRTYLEDGQNLVHGLKPVLLEWLLG